MTSQLRVATGQCSERGRKPVNQDFHGICIPAEPQLSAKGIAMALADGISSSEVSQIAAEAAVSGFLADYFSTPETWSVKKSAQRVLTASNSWLHAQTRQSPYRYDSDRGYVCTFSAVIFKSNTAHLFHVGDARIYRLRAGSLEQLSQDHRLRVSAEQSYLARALGMNPHVEIDYQALPLECGDLFLILTDGVYEYLEPRDLLGIIERHPQALDAAARALLARAFAQGSDDNLTAQLLRIDELPRQDAGERHRQLTDLPMAPILEPRQVFDGYLILRQLYASSRSHLYLATDTQTQATVVLKTPSIDREHDPAHLERFLNEEWIARRIDSPHVLRPAVQNRQRRYLYSVSEFIDGQTLSQWLIDNPRPALETVRAMVEQIARGLQAFHRLEMLHQDLRPDNIMLDRDGTLKIVDFGSTRVAGLLELGTPRAHQELLGTAQYSAPEYFLGEAGSPRSDLFSLAVITYQMLTGALPYGAEVARCRSRAAQLRLSYQPARHANRELPAWIDDVLKKALAPNPAKRYGELSEFVFELRQPSAEFLNRSRPPLLERDPVLFWKGLSALLAASLLAVLLLG
jgi:serine/threonine protein phosphatase PrpC